MPNSDHGGPLGTRVMTIFGSHVVCKVQILIDEIFLQCPYGHLQADFLLFIIELDTRNPNLGIPALEDGLFANSLILNYL